LRLKYRSAYLLSKISNLKAPTCLAVVYPLYMIDSLDKFKVQTEVPVSMNQNI
jgi:hypothetical protein